MWHELVQQHLLRRSEVEFLRSLPLRPRLLTMCHMTADLSRAQLKEEEFLGEEILWRKVWSVVSHVVSAWGCVANLKLKEGICH